MHHLDGLGAALGGKLHMPTSPGYDAARRPALFENMPPDRIELELVRYLTTPQGEDLMQHVTHLRYGVHRP